MTKTPPHRRAVPRPVPGNRPLPHPKAATAAPENRAVLSVPATRAAPAEAPAKTRKSKGDDA